MAKDGTVIFCTSAVVIWAVVSISSIVANAVSEGGSMTLVKGLFAKFG